MIKKISLVCLILMILLIFSGLSISQPVKSNLGWFVGQNGIIIRWNGSSWSDIPTNTSNDYRGVDFYKTYYGFAVGTSGKIMRWDGSKWNNITSPTSSLLTDVKIYSSSDAWAIGAGGTIIKWGGSSWTDYATSPTADDLWSIDFLSPNNGWGVGENGTIIKWNGTSWSTATSPISTDLYSVDMVNSNFGVAVGLSGKIIHWNGTSWNEVTSPISNNLRAVYMVKATDGWAVGDSGAIIHWNGNSWAEYTHSLTSNNLMTVNFNNGNSHDGWIGGNAGVILRYDGQDWSTFASPTGSNLFAGFIITSTIDPHSSDRYEADTDECAYCHRSHTATGTHLTIPQDPYEECITCHDGTISFYDIQSEFASDYRHTIEGLDSNSAKNCASCHESHQRNNWSEEYLIDPLDAKDIWQIVATTSPNYNNASSPSGLYVWCERCHTDSSITGNYFEETMNATYKPYTVKVIWQTSKSPTSTPPGVDESGTTSGFWQYFRANTYNDTSALGDKHGRASGSSASVNYFNGYTNNYPALPCTQCHRKHGSDRPWMLDTAFDLDTVSGQQNYCTSICHDLGTHPAPDPPVAKCTDCHHHGLRF